MTVSKTDNRCLLALDLGTTTLAGRLLSATGEVLAEARAVNPQRELGGDILLRLQRAHDGAGPRLHELLVEGLKDLVAELLLQAGRTAKAVGAAAAAGNPGMSCLLGKFPVAPLLYPPHKPAHKQLLQLPATEPALGLPVPLDLLPQVSGFVGGDFVACLFGLGRVAPGTLCLDIGTNAELGLWDGARWIVASAAAGPAFEGGNIDAGMACAPGAVTDVSLDGDRLRFAVAGDIEPRGLCGSGLVALVSAGLQGGLIDATGRIVPAGEVETNLARYLVEQQDGWAIRFHHSAGGSLLLTQTDLRNLQFAKGAVLAGVKVLLERGGLPPAGVERVLLTGAMGTALPAETLKRVALLPEAMVDKSLFIANGVLTGLERYLVASGGAQQLKALLKTMQPFPLSGTPAFERHFLGSLDF